MELAIHNVALYILWCCFISSYCLERNNRMLGNMDNTESRLHQLEIEMQAKNGQIQSLMDNLSQLQQKVAASDGPVAFYATLTKTRIILGELQGIDFDHVVTNLGQGYNNMTGAFVVPLNGVYHMSSTLFGNGAGDIHLQMMRNQQEIGRSYGNLHQSSAVINSVISLNKGDTVYVRHSQVKGETHDIVYGDGYASFSGFLIR